MKTPAVIFALAIMSVAIFLPLTFNIQAANAQASSYSIDRVDHNVQVLYSGNVVITDTIQLSGTIPSAFLIGVPFRYSPYILKATAFDSNFNILPVTLGVQLQDQSGFYAASISLPAGTSNKFTIAFILSNGAVTKTTSGFNLDFPAYPSLTQAVSTCNVTITLPPDVSVAGVDKPDGVVNASSFTKQNLAAFTYSPAIGTLTAPVGAIQEITIPTLTRQIGVSASGAVTVTDTYRIVNNSTGSIPWMLVNLPLNAQNIAARDQFGRVLTTSTYQTNSLVFVQNVTLAVAMNPGELADLSLDYTLPNIPQGQSSRYTVNLDLFPYFNYYINSASVTMTTPEGANIITPQLSQLGPNEVVTRSAFQQSLSVSKEGVSYIDSVIPSQETLTVVYDFSPLWISFRPTSWMFAISVVGIVIVALYLRPRAKSQPQKMAPVRIPAGLTLSPENIQRFVDAYEEKISITSEIRTLEAKAAHGRIPRRRYKVQRQTLEERLESVAGTVAQLREVMRKAGGNYADLVEQIEAAEIEVEEVGLSLKNIEVRHETGEISIEAYRKQLADLEKRKEKAEAALNGLLMRVRSEIR